jgi:D-alanyl-D-alanine carboxypeptidase-like protein
MSLGEERRLFTKMVGKLMTKAYELGYELMLEEAYRPPVTAAYYESIGAGVKNSWHGKGLAVDFVVLKNGVILKHGEDFRDLGAYWISIGGTWGQRFSTRRDGNHFSLGEGKR